MTQVLVSWQGNWNIQRFNRDRAHFIKQMWHTSFPTQLFPINLCQMGYNTPTTIIPDDSYNFTSLCMLSNLATFLTVTHIKYNTTTDVWRNTQLTLHFSSFDRSRTFTFLSSNISTTLTSTTIYMLDTMSTPTFTDKNVDILSLA